MDLERLVVEQGVRLPHAQTANAAPEAAPSVQQTALVVDLCSGLGGLSLAAKQLGMTVVAGIDTDKDSLKTFSHNFPGAAAINATISGSRSIDACKIALERYVLEEKPLIILSGPPCQGFSPAGSRDPKDKRNKALLGAARGISSLQPRCALIENVQELLTKKHRRRFKDLERCLSSAGYHLLAIELNAKEYGVPQNRERAFLLITRQKLDRQAVLGRLRALRMPEISCGEVLEPLPSAPVRAAKYDDGDDSRRSLPNHLAMRHSQGVRKKIAAIPVGRGPMSYRKLDPDKPANTLFSGHRAPPAHYKYARSITVREAARLQGFPDDFAIRGPFANQMMQVTNAVPPPLARVVLAVLIEFVGVGKHGNG